MSAFAYHGVCMMMMTMTIDVWHTEVSVANGSQTGKQNTACCDLKLPFRFFPLGGIAYANSLTKAVAALLSHLHLE